MWHIKLQSFMPSSTLPFTFRPQGQKLGAEYEVTLLRPQLQGVKVGSLSGSFSTCNNWGEPFRAILSTFMKLHSIIRTLI
jgi:hypothetical protein